MRINSLEITNFRVLKKTNMTFPDQVIGIVGQNGSGKSSLIEAIAWALYGNQAARTGKDEIKSTFAAPSEICEVKVKFSINEESFTVIRRLSGKSDRAEVELYRGDSSESVGVHETKNYVAELLGLDWRGFLSSFLARQSELNALSDLPPAKRRDHIAGMLGIQRLDKAISRLKEDTKQHKDKVLFLERHLREKESIEKAIIELNDQLLNLQKPLQEQTEKTKQLDKKFESAQTEFEQVTKKRIEYLNLKADLAAHEESSKQLSGQRTKLEKEQKELVDLQVQLNKLNESKSALAQVELQYEQQTEAKNKIELQNTLKNQIKTIQLKQTEISAQIDKSTEKLTKLEQTIKNLPPNLEQQLIDKKQELEEKRNSYSRAKAELEQLNKEKQKLQTQLSQISEFKADSVCERCHRPFGDDFHTIQTHLSEELEQFDTQIKSKETEMLEVQNMGTKVKEQFDILQQAEKDKISLLSNKESTISELIKLKKSHLEYHESEIKITNDINQLGTISFDEKLYQKLSTQRIELTNINDSINTLQGTLAREASIIRELDENHTLQQKVIETIELKKAELHNTGYSDDLFEKISVNFNQLRNSFDTAKNELHGITRESELTETALKGKQEQKKQFQKSEKEFEISKSAHYYGEKLTGLLSLFRQNLIASIRPSLAETASQLFDEMTDHKYSMVELDEKYDLRVMDNGVYYGVERFSGGEKDLANLCLRLAISLALTESAGLNRSFIILDEVFGSQDNERKELILKALANLKNRFPQILLITHVDDIKDGVEQVFEVIAKESGFSEVIIHES